MRRMTLTLMTGKVSADRDRGVAVMMTIITNLMKMKMVIMMMAQMAES